MANVKITDMPAAGTLGLTDLIPVVTGGVNKSVDGQDVVDVVKTNLATGTPTGSKFLRDDFSWQTPAGGGGGGSKTYAVFTPMTSQPPASNFATLDTRNSIAVLDFDDTTSESVYWVGVIPEGASLGSGIIVRIHWTATTSTSNSVVWGVSFEKAGTDLDSDSFDTETTGSSTTNGTSGIETITAITCTTIDGLTAGDMFRLRIARKTADGSDTMTGDAEVIAVEVRAV